MENMKKMYEWLTTWDRAVSQQDKKRKLEPESEGQISQKRRVVKIDRRKLYTRSNAFSSASVPDTSDE